jgi:hypothetical protein
VRVSDEWEQATARDATRNERGQYGVYLVLLPPGVRMQRPADGSLFAYCEVSAEAMERHSSTTDRDWMIETLVKRLGRAVARSWGRSRA